MRIANIIKNDVVNGEGVCVSLFVQGCHKHCPGCFNSETWDFNGGYEIQMSDLINELITAISANGIQRNFSILGGEPLAPSNVYNTMFIIKEIKQVYPDIKIWIWTGYTLEELKAREGSFVRQILSMINVLVDGPYIEAERDLSLPYRGSRNQRIIKLKEN